MLQPLMSSPLWWFCAAVVLAAPIRLSAAIPGAGNPDVYTEHQFRQQELEYNLRTTVKPYKQVGHRNAKWDDAAIAFLTEQSRYMANSGSQMQYHLLGVKTAAELEQLARKAIDAGCDDPLVQDMYSITLRDQHKQQEETPVLRRAADALLDSQYPVQRAGNSARRALGSVDPKAEPDLHRQYEQRVYDLDLAVAALAELPGIDRRLFLRFLEQDMEGWTPEKQALFCAELKKTNADPWLMNLLSGQYHITTAWRARGTGWASSVTDEGWRTMHTELAEARKCLLEAQRLQPRFPEAATKMIAVVMGDGESGPGDSLRDWFDRAVEGQFDYELAYSSYRYALLPRWHGSYPTMYSFGVECAKTGKYDTRVPLQLIDVLLAITEDAGGDWAFWSTPGVLEEVAEALGRSGESRIAVPEDRAFCYSQIVGYAWQAHRYDIGRGALDKLQGKLNAQGIALTQTIGPRTLSGTYAMTGPAAADLRQAEASAAGGSYSEATETYKRIAAQTKPGDPSLPWLRGRAQELMWQQKFQAGDWVDLITPDPEMAGWYAIAGSGRSDGQSILIQSDENWGQLICGTKFGLRWELRGQVQVLAEGSQDKAAENKADGGPVLCWISSWRYCHLSFGQKKLGWRYDREATFWSDWPEMPEQNSFLVSMWDGSAGVLLNGAEYLSSRKLGEIGTRPDNRIGLSSCGLPAGAKIKVSQLQIRKLDKAPKGVGAEN